MQQIVSHRLVASYKHLPAIGKLAASLLICGATGIASDLMSHSGSDTWFNSLVKPSWNPPGYLFAPIGTVLYFLMGIALWLILKSDAPAADKKYTVSLFAIQLFLNFLWSVFFFKFQLPALAFLDSILMFIAILLTMFSFGAISKLACWLLLPCILWVSFATILNCQLWSLNQ